MKMFTVAAVAAAMLALAPAALAQQPTPLPANKADCEKAKMKWDDKGGKDGKGACVATPAAAPAKPDDAAKK
jgi:Spy/CpxP family protein refolding chaperone